MKLIRIANVALLLALPISTAFAGGPPDPCTDALLKMGAIIPAAEFIARLTDLSRYLGEFLEQSSRLGTDGVILAHEGALHELAAQNQQRPVVTFTTFSREESENERYLMNTHFLGFLSAIPKGRVIVGSGGTMGNVGQAETTGGGVGLIQSAAVNMGFKTLSLVTGGGLKYRAAPADYLLLLSLGENGSESRQMYKLSNALVIIGGGKQAYREAVEYLNYNPDGFLVIIDEPAIGGSSQELLRNEEFKALAAASPNIIVARTGTEAGQKLAEKLGIQSRVEHIQTLAERRLNVIGGDVDFHALMPNSKVIGFSGWSDFSRAGPNLQSSAEDISTRVSAALARIHLALGKVAQPIFYATAGNDPKFASTSVPAFETLVHKLDLHPHTRLLALTASQLNLAELNPKVSSVAFISPTWGGRTQQFVNRADALITAGGNAAVIDQARFAAEFEQPHLHISGASTLTDLRLAQLQNPKLRILSPSEVEKLTDAEIFRLLGLQGAPQ